MEAMERKISTAKHQVDVCFGSETDLLLTWLASVRHLTIREAKKNLVASALRNPEPFKEERG